MAKFRDCDVRKVPMSHRHIVCLMNKPGKKTMVDSPEKLKANLLAEVSAAIDEKLATMTEGQGLGIVFRLEVMVPSRSKEWVAAVKKRDGNKCERCGSTEKIEAHHVLSVSIHPESMDDVDNGITLCINCHADEHPKIKPLMLSKRKKNGATNEV